MWPQEPALRLNEWFQEEASHEEKRHVDTVFGKKSGVEVILNAHIYLLAGGGGGTTGIQADQHGLPLSKGRRPLLRSHPSPRPLPASLISAANCYQISASNEKHSPASPSQLVSI